MSNGASVVSLGVTPKQERTTYKGTQITVTYVMQGKHRGMWEWRFAVSQPMSFNGYASKLERAMKDAKSQVDKLNAS